MDNEQKTEIHQKVETARSGRLPGLVASLPSGFVVMGGRQVTRGYCLLLPDPVVPSLNALKGEARTMFLNDMALVGDALMQVTTAARINYEILGNKAPALHAHILPRYAEEAADLREKPIWFFDWDKAPAYSEERDSELREQISAAIERLRGA